jgi:hypothetical protein
MLSISCADRLLPSKDEADRLQRLLPKCKIYFFEKHGHSLLLVRFIYLTGNRSDHNKSAETKTHDFRNTVFMLQVSSSALTSTATRGSTTGCSTTSLHLQLN